MVEAERVTVWRDYTQEELDFNYNQRTIVPDWQDYFDHNRRESERVRAAFDCRLDVAYGPSPDEILDIFPAPRAEAPVVVYIHGGAWTRTHKDSNSYQAEAFVGAGICFVSVHFGLVPSVTLDEQVQQNRSAVAWVRHNAREFGVDPERIYVAGHSSGGHNTGMMITTDWEAAFGLPRDMIKGALACSGIYELEPARLSARNEYLKLDDAGVQRNSPIRHIPDDGCSLVVGYGECEHKEFRRQSVEFAAAWRKRGNPCQEFDLPGLNHFQVGQQFANPNSPILTAMFEMISA